MNTCLIAPTPLLDTYLHEHDDMHLTLAHMVLQDADYRRFYLNRSRQGDFIILDNSAHEFGEGFSAKKLLQAAEMIEADEIILPDRMFWGDDTFELSEVAANKIVKSGFKGSMMGVPQGRTFEEYYECALNLMTLPINTLGISKDYEVWPGGLAWLLRRVIMMATQPVDIHLLGWGRDLNQLSLIAGRPDLYPVRSVDSAKPFTFAYSGIYIPEPGQPSPKYPTRPHNYFGLRDLVYDVCQHNIEMFKTYAKQIPTDKPARPEGD